MIIEECVMILPEHIDPLFLMPVVENGREFAGFNFFFIISNKNEKI